MYEYGEYVPGEPHGSNAENRGYSPNAEKTLSLSRYIRKGALHTYAAPRTGPARTATNVPRPDYAGVIALCRSCRGAKSDVHCGSGAIPPLPGTMSE
ncbi:hypothetical protein CGZ88_0870 [Bifidobacterium anseris]|uniref:Uncharacterized protein n=1 Tax=Bifidobacterium anseris TaxID=2020963 RepID=A0A2N5IZG2_9BIFI|nr:hypothetical protein CGZ88_0870 [Bifidobacterium anseris]